jgi:ferric-dicitrate binding protein FerR (iron transport regulator)
MAKKRNVEDTAVSWLIQVKTAEHLGKASWDAFEAWLDERKEHRAAYLQVEEAWRTLETVKAPGARRRPASAKVSRSPVKPTTARGKKKRR